MEKNMETTIMFFKGSIGTMEKKMETTIMTIQGFYSPNNAKSNGQENGT